MNVLTYGEWRDTCDTVHMLLQMGKSEAAIDGSAT